MWNRLYYVDTKYVKNETPKSTMNSFCKVMSPVKKINKIVSSSALLRWYVKPCRELNMLCRGEDMFRRSQATILGLNADYYQL